MRPDIEYRFPAVAGFLASRDAEALLRAAPQMTLYADVRSLPHDAPPLLNRAAPFDRLRLARLALEDTAATTTEGLVFMLHGLAAMQPGQPIPLRPVHACIAPLATALQACHSLTWLRIAAPTCFKPAQSLAMILMTLASHPSLRVLELSLAEPTLRGGAGAAALRALCELVEADTPVLEELRIDNAVLGDAELSPLLGGALAHNSHLRVLDCGDDSAISDALAAEQLLPAVRAATALRQLRAGAVDVDDAPALREVQALLRARVDTDELA
jgi:hypothetical protein